MAKFIIEYTEEIWNSIEVEADTKEQARERFFRGEYNLDDSVNIGGEIHPDISVTQEQVSA